MIHNFFAFIGAVAIQWFFWIGLILMIEPYLEAVAPLVADILERFFNRRPARRQMIFRLAGALALVFACFQAWEVQYEAAGNNQNRFAMKELLHTAINEGEELNKDWFKRTDADAYRHEANVWANKTGHLIEDAYGRGEADVFVSDAGIISYGNPSQPELGIHSEINNRLQRLNELMSRVEVLLMRPGFNPNNYHWVTQCDAC